MILGGGRPEKVVSKPLRLKTLSKEKNEELASFEMPMKELLETNLLFLLIHVSQWCNADKWSSLWQPSAQMEYPVPWDWFTCSKWNIPTKKKNAMIIFKKVLIMCHSKPQKLTQNVIV